MHILENIPHLVQTLLLSAATEVSLGLLPAPTTPQPPVGYLELLEFAVKGKLLQVSNCAKLLHIGTI